MIRRVRCLLPLLWPLLACSKPASREHGGEAPAQAVQIDVERHAVPLLPEDEAIGGAAPLVTLVVFGNYACPPCGRTWLMMRNLVEDYGDDIRVVYRHAPIPGYQPGDLAAEAAVAAGEQGHFWEYHWRLVEHGTEDLSRPMLLSHAEALGLDVDKFSSDLDGGVGSARLARHRRHAVALGIAAGPVTFVNGLVLMGARNDEKAWHGLVDAELARARALVREGTPRTDVYTAMMDGAKTGPIRESQAASNLREQAKDKPADSDKAGVDTLARPQADRRYSVVASESPSAGPADAPVLVVAFVDFQCPFCRKSAGLLTDLRDKYPDDVRVAVQHLPLEIHPTAKGAAIASMAAHRQGKFWPFYDGLLTTEQPAGMRLFAAMAIELGLDVEQFKRDFEDPTVRASIEADVAYARRLGVSGTPAYFVNGQFLYGQQSLATIADLVDRELAAAAKLSEAGTARAELFGKLMAAAVPEDQFPNASVGGED